MQKQRKSDDPNNDVAAKKLKSLDAPTADELLEAARVESERLREIEKLQKLTRDQEERKGLRVRKGRVQVGTWACCEMRWRDRE